MTIRIPKTSESHAILYVFIPEPPVHIPVNGLPRITMFVLSFADNVAR
jgi:hypothetical protein